MLLRPANLRILDEPTNHLDMPAKEMLEEALQHYDGTVLLVSHDRYFISRVATKIVEIHEGELRLYRGDYHYYLDKVAADTEAEKQAALEVEKKAKAEAKRKQQQEKRKASASK